MPPEHGPPDEVRTRRTIRLTTVGLATWALATLGLAVAAVAFAASAASEREEGSQQDDKVVEYPERVTKLREGSAEADAAVETLKQQLADTQAALSATQQRVGELEAAVAAADAIPAPPPTPPTIVLTDSTLLRVALNEACQEIAGANVRPEVQPQFEQEFHDEEREQQTIAQQGGTYYVPNPFSSALAFAGGQFGRCY